MNLQIICALVALMMAICEGSESGRMGKGFNAQRVIQWTTTDLMNVNIRLNNDLKNLLLVFLETDETHPFREYVQDCISQNGVSLIFRPYSKPIGVDDHGNIIEINLMSNQMRDCAIGDISKLPSTLKRVVLMDNKLTKLSLAVLPRGLEYVNLRDNELIKIEVDSRLSLGITKTLHIELDGNHLRPADFDKLSQCRNTRIYGRSKQLTEQQIDERDRKRAVERRA